LTSPWVDLAINGDSITAQAAVDLLLSDPYSSDLAIAHLILATPLHPLASLRSADLHGVPPLLIQVGSAEILLDDAVRLARGAGAADVRVTLEVWPDMIHAWHLFYQQVAAGRRALAAVGVFVHAMLNS